MSTAAQWALILVLAACALLAALIVRPLRRRYPRGPSAFLRAVGVVGVTIVLVAGAAALLVQLLVQLVQPHVGQTAAELIAAVPPLAASAVILAWRVRRRRALRRAPSFHH
ncbi:hypothetical protein ACFOYW_16995 [Gryllotalpicola reticulitermitis]|uniref:Uncharacterized protein n=1 Tax=Gryllotalpicola reticulitermitis TaxID=1184153 RepID=A0ABV8QC61_9MICO